ncbi:hypothetical protein [Plantactinospora sp. BC1]|uniref:hypothetical protein n=1 Tax=Plantactinospora sp. BC1 TaxID=2108470 RepID=UPI00131F266A|nr:hypothetical protein [Plantactinospora sp. BC1]
MVAALASTAGGFHPLHAIAGPEWTGLPVWVDGIVTGIMVGGWQEADARPDQPDPAGRRRPSLSPVAPSHGFADRDPVRAPPPRPPVPLPRGDRPPS